MTDRPQARPRPRSGCGPFGAPKPEQAVEIEKLGYGAVWVGGSPAADLSFVEPILEQTETLQVATGIVNVWTAEAERGRRVVSPHRGCVSRSVPARRRRRPSRAHRGVPQALRRAGRVPRRARRREGADQPTGHRRARAEGAQAVGAAQRGRAPVPDHAGAHRAGARIDRATRCIWRPSTRWC